MLTNDMRRAFSNHDEFKNDKLTVGYQTGTQCSIEWSEYRNRVIFVDDTYPRLAMV